MKAHLFGCLLFASTWALVACEPDPSGGGPGGGEAGPVDGGGGAGGEEGDAGGECGSLSGDACAHRADCVVEGSRCRDAAGAACELLGEGQCAGRADCEARADVFGEFADCRPRTADCADLDAAGCAARADCEWHGDACRTPAPITCAQRAEDTCAEAGCHWWDGACHDEPAPARCDQPDPGACEAAGCVWSAGGCGEPDSPACETLREAPCNGRPDCRWRGNRCEVDPRGLDCADLTRDTCPERADCVWSPDGCTDRPEGECDALDERACDLRPDCRPIRAGDPVAGDFLGCELRVLRCADVPLEACDATPGCHVADGQCVDDEHECGQLDIGQCAQEPRCRVIERQECIRDGGDGRPICEIHRTCEPADCRHVQDPDACAARPDCELAGGGGGGLVCQPRAPQACESLGLLECRNTPGCEVRSEEVCRCNEGRPDEPCVCFLHEYCVTVAERCADLDPERCAARADCLFQEAGDACLCADEDGDGEPDDCPECRPGPHCRDANEVCGGHDEAVCAELPGCAPIEILQCDGGGGACPPGEPCVDPPEQCAPFHECAPAAQVCPELAEDHCAATPLCVSLQHDGAYLGCAFPDQCRELDEARCNAHPACEYLDEAPPPDCVCRPGPDGREICVCDGDGLGGCVPAGGGNPPDGACRDDSDCGERASCIDGQCVIDLPQPVP